MNQKEFYFKLAAAIYRIDGAYEILAKQSKTKPNLLWLMYALNDGESHTQCQICRDWNFARSTVNTLIKECEEKGYISLHQIKGERRELEIKLTQKGKAFAAGILDPVYKLEEELFKEYFKKNSTDFVGCLEKFANACESKFRGGENYE